MSHLKFVKNPSYLVSRESPDIETGLAKIGYILSVRISSEGRVTQGEGL
jgi:hypothetical protein